MDPLDVAKGVGAALKDPALIAAVVWAAIELRALRRHVGRLFTKSEELEDGQAALETRVAVLEDRSSLPVARPPVAR